MVPAGVAPTEEGEVEFPPSRSLTAVVLRPGSLTCHVSPLRPQLSGGCELTVVIHDFTACNSTELTIRRGQTVEVLERPHDKPDWCLVRTTDRSPAAEGLVPCGSLCIAHSRSSMEMEGIFNHKGRTPRAWVAVTLPARNDTGTSAPVSLQPCARCGSSLSLTLQSIIAVSLGCSSPQGTEAGMRISPVS